MGVKSIILVAPLALALASPASRAAPLNLYEWIAVAPVVVAGKNLGTHGKYAEFTVENVYRGETAGEIKVNVRRANRDRDRFLYKHALRFEEGESYLLLLVQVATRDPDGKPTFELIRGVRGARQVPPEGDNWKGPPEGDKWEGPPQGDNWEGPPQGAHRNRGNQTFPLPAHCFHACNTTSTSMPPEEPR